MPLHVEVGLLFLKKKKSMPTWRKDSIVINHHTQVGPGKNWDHSDFVHSVNRDPTHSTFSTLNADLGIWVALGGVLYAVREDTMWLGVRINIGTTMTEAMTMGHPKGEHAKQNVTGAVGHVRSATVIVRDRGTQLRSSQNQSLKGNNNNSASGYKITRSYISCFPSHTRFSSIKFGEGVHW